jgi:nucleoside-diphosphate-sugar epimerase
MIVLTGGSGFIGSQLLPELTLRCSVVALSRNEVTAAGWVQGSFAEVETLRALDGIEIHTAIHLAAVLGDCSEEEGLLVNVLGTGTFLRYVIDRGCRRLIVASSIAAVGCMSPSFIPRVVPIPDDYPCEAVDPYGLSKGLMEDLCAYFGRRHPDLELTLFRIGSVIPDEAAVPDEMRIENSTLPFLMGGLVAVGDVVDALMDAVATPLGPGVRRFNLVAPAASTRMNTAEALAVALKARRVQLDTSFYENESRAGSSLYTLDGLIAAYGHGPQRALR